MTVNRGMDINEAPYFDKESRDEGREQSLLIRTGVVLDPKTVPIMYAENRRTEVVALAAIEPDGDSLQLGAYWRLMRAPSK